MRAPHGWSWPPGKIPNPPPKSPPTRPRTTRDRQETFEKLRKRVAASPLLQVRSSSKVLERADDRAVVAQEAIATFMMFSKRVRAFHSRGVSVCAGTPAGSGY
jgi:hypothetical protein